MSKKPSVVIIGGGTGTFTVLSALRRENLNLTALMTMVDDGGSNRILRDEFGLLPTSGIRQAMVALSGHQPFLRELFMYRFHQGTGISGMTLGNLFLAAMADICGSQEIGIETTCRFLKVRGNIYPISLDNVRLVATYSNGTQVLGEHQIDQPSHDGKLHIDKLSTIPVAKISPKAKHAIESADFIIFGPGDLYGNTIANLIVDGVVPALQKSRAKLIFIFNLMTKYGETYNYLASDYLRDISKYLPLSRIDYLIINNDQKYPQTVLQKYLQEYSSPVQDDLSDQNVPGHIKIIRAPLVSPEIVSTQPGDLVKRSIIRHDTKKLKKLLISIFT